VEEDPSLALEQTSDTHQLLLKGQGEMHVRVALERLERKYGIVARRFKRQVAYKETIRKPTKVRGRHKKQSGGHGQFGDCVIEIAPEIRGAGFRFAERIVGGAIPRQYIPSVEIGVQEAMKAGPLGFPVVDVSVTVVDGSYHSVDSSDMAFRQAGRIAMADGLPACSPVLLEPVMRVEIMTPSDGTARVNAMIPQRRGQILGIEPFDGIAGEGTSGDGMAGWDRIEALIPDAEMDDLIIELRSATSGVGTFRATHDHLAELTGKLAEQVMTSHAQAAE
jgi:elongation factor G